MDRIASRAAPPVPLTWERERDQIVVLRTVTWHQYESLERARGDVRRPRIAYLDGELELVTTSEHHERIKKLLGRLVDAYAEERGLRLDAFGNATLRKKAQHAGVEPDDWYKIHKGSKRPDLVVEVVFTSGGVDKLEIYRRLGVAEVWFWVNGKLWVYHLMDVRYEERTTSIALPGIDFGELERVVAACDEHTDQLQLIRAYRRSLSRARR